jgi:hypothetical protein
MSRKKEIREMANLVGNSAAHIALLPDSEFAQKEATTYTEDAADTAAGRTWTGSEIKDFTERARKRSVSELKARMKKYGLSEKQMDIFVERAQKYILAFASNHLEES